MHSLNIYGMLFSSFVSVLFFGWIDVDVDDVISRLLVILGIRYDLACVDFYM